MVFKKRFFLFFIVIFIIACGNRRSPTGGPVDNIKPEIIYTTPLDFEQIVDNQIVISFSKPMDKTSVMNGLSFYPPIINKKMVWDKNTLKITMRENLKINTNLIMNLSKNIKCERNNSFENDQVFVFRNGELQNNKLSGLVVFEDKEDIGSEVSFSLLDKDSLLVFNKKITDLSYSFDFLNSGNYILNAFADKNKNNRYDYGIEPFFTTKFELPIKQMLNINLVIADTVKPNLKKINSLSDNQIILEFNKELARLPIIFIVDDSTANSPKIIFNELQGESLHIITSQQDSTRYRIQISGLIDKRGNEKNTIITFFDSKGISDEISPKVIESFPKNGAVFREQKPEFSVLFSEILFSDNVIITLTEFETNRNIALKSINKAGLKLRYMPLEPLKNFNSYILKISQDTADLSGNTLKEDFIVQFIVSQ